MAQEFLVISLRNQTVFEQLLQEADEHSSVVIGLEVVSPKLADKLFLNIDPQHTDKRSDSSAILEVLNQREDLLKKIEDKKIIMVTERADVDSVGAMAILRLAMSERAHDLNSEELASRVVQVNDFDNAAFNRKWAPTSIDEAICHNTKIAGIHKAIGDFKLPMAEKVKIMEEWLLTGQQPQNYVEAFNQDVGKIKEGIKDGTIHIEQTEKGMTILESTLPLAPLIGYSYTPVVVALNDQFIDPVSKSKTVKYTIAQYNGVDFLNVQNLTQSLNALENAADNKWGGNPNLVASPMGVGTKLAKDDILRLTEENIKPGLIEFITQAYEEKNGAIDTPSNYEELGFSGNSSFVDAVSD
jgi:hypothetical protein